MIDTNRVHLIVTVKDPPPMNDKRPVDYVRYLINAIETGQLTIEVHQFGSFSPEMAAVKGGTPIKTNTYRPQ